MADSNDCWKPPASPVVSIPLPWARTFAIFLYCRGLSLRKVACDLESRGVPRSHVTVWIRLQKLGEHLPIRAAHAGIPARIVVDWTWVQVGFRSCWIFAAIDPKSWGLLYLRPTFS